MKGKDSTQYWWATSSCSWVDGWVLRIAYSNKKYIRNEF